MTKNFLSKWALSGATIILSICLVVLLLNGCSTNSTEPITENNSEFNLDWLQNLNGPDLVPGYINTGSGINVLEEATGTIDVSNTVGGKLEIYLGGKKVKFWFANSNAVDSAELVTITITGQLIETPYGEIYLYECSPDGLVFEEPIHVHQDVNTTKTEAGFFYFNETIGLWELQDVQPISNGRVKFDIYHFSKYGISY